MFRLHQETAHQLELCAAHPLGAMGLYRAIRQGRGGGELWAIIFIPINEVWLLHRLASTKDPIESVDG